MIPPNTTSQNKLPVIAISPQANPTIPQRFNKTDRLGREVIELLKGAIAEAQRAKGKEIIALVGNTGTGKSTAVNQFLERKMCFVRSPDTGRGVIQVSEGDEEVAKIGHRPGTSETRYARIYEKKGSPFIFADCGGFFDTRGVSTDIAVVSSLKLTLENAKSVKLVLCFDSSVIMTDRAIHFSQSFNLALGTLLRDYQKHSDAVILMFTKPKRDVDGTMFNAEMAKQILANICDDLIDGPQKKLYRFLLRDNGKYIAVCDPLSDESKQANLSTFMRMGAIHNTKEAFQTAYSAHSQLKLLEEMTAIAVAGSDLYNRHFSLNEMIFNYKKEITELSRRMTIIQEAIKQIGNGLQDPQEIRSAEEAIIRQSQELIKQQEERAHHLSGKIEESRLRIEAVKEKISLLERRGEEELEYWSDQINQDGINIESKTVTVTTHEKSGWFSSSSHSETATTSTYDKRSIPRDFFYRGPEIVRVVKDPGNADRWSNERKTADTYSIHYESEKGEPAIASVKVFVKRKHMPAEISERGGYEKEITHEQTLISQLSLDLNEMNKVIGQAALGIAAKGNTLEKLTIYTNIAKELQESLTTYESQFKEKGAMCAFVESEIANSKEDIDFLISYLELSNDTQLKGKEIIAKLLQQHKDYQGQAK